MAAFLDADGLNLFYGLIAAKFGSGSPNGSMEFASAVYTGDGATEISNDLTISNLTIPSGIITGSSHYYDLALITGDPINSNGVSSLGLIWANTVIGNAGTGLSIYRDPTADIVTISMLRNVYLQGFLDTTNQPSLHMKYGSLPAGFTPYDPAFTALAPDYTKAMLRDQNTRYRIGLFKFFNSVMAT